MLLLLAGHGVQREVADVELRAVRGKAGVNPCGYAGAKVAADGGSAHQEDFRLILLDDAGQCMGIRLRPVLLQLGIVHHDDPVSAVLGQLVRQALHVASHQNSSNLASQIRGQILALADQFKSNAVDDIVHLLREDIYALIFF